MSCPPQHFVSSREISASAGLRLRSDEAGSLMLSAGVGMPV